VYVFGPKGRQVSREYQTRAFERVGSSLARTRTEFRMPVDVGPFFGQVQHKHDCPMCANAKLLIKPVVLALAAFSTLSDTCNDDDDAI